MNKKDFGEILKKSFGKEKDENYHAKAMLIIYGIFFFALVLMVRLGGNNNTNTTNNNTNNTSGKEVVEPTAAPTPSPAPTSKPKENNKISSDVNYSYSYTTVFDGETEVYLGKRVDDKQKFSYVKNGQTVEYAIKDDNYLIYNGLIYSLVDKLDTYFKYCDVEKILDLVEESVPTYNGNLVEYRVENVSISKMFNDTLANDNGISNRFILNIENDVLKSVKLDLTNYISSLIGATHTLTINMDFANIGTTEDFDINLN